MRWPRRRPAPTTDGWWITPVAHDPADERPPRAWNDRAWIPPVDDGLDAADADVVDDTIVFDEWFAATVLPPRVA